MSTANDSFSQFKCSKCGEPLTLGTRFCANCGAPSLLPVGLPERTAAASAARKPRRWNNILLFTLTGAIVLLVGLILVAVVFLNLKSSPVPTVTLVTDQAVDPQTMQSLENSVSEIEAAFRARNIDQVIRLTHPAARSDLQPIFQARAGELSRVADLLATRKLVSVSNAMAEYEVTENGATFTVTFEAWGDRWYLSSL